MTNNVATLRRRLLPKRYRPKVVDDPVTGERKMIVRLYIPRRRKNPTTGKVETVLVRNPWIRKGD
jgi:hypothetical protein